MTSLNDCLSLQHFGQLLNEINQRSLQTPRKLTEQFKTGKPNLIVCQPQDTWNIILSIYMHSSELPLPSSDEVLICDEDTAFEEVELLLRRAMQTDDRSSKSDC